MTASLRPFVVALAMLSCQSGDSSSGPMPVPTKEPPAGFAVDTGALRAKADAGSASDESRRPELSEAELEQLAAMLPELDGVRVLEALRLVPGARMARAVYCVAGSPKDAAALFVSGYQASKWQGLDPREPPGRLRNSFNGRRSGYRLSGTAYQGEFSECSRKDQETRVSVSFQRGPGLPAPSVQKGVLKADRAQD